MNDEYLNPVCTLHNEAEVREVSRGRQTLVTFHLYIYTKVFSCWSR